MVPHKLSEPVPICRGRRYRRQTQLRQIRATTWLFGAAALIGAALGGASVVATPQSLASVEALVMPIAVSQVRSEHVRLRSGITGHAVTKREFLAAPRCMMGSLATASNLIETGTELRANRMQPCLNRLICEPTFDSCSGRSGWLRSQAVKLSNLCRVTRHSNDRAAGSLFQRPRQYLATGSCDRVARGNLELAIRIGKLSACKRA